MKKQKVQLLSVTQHLRLKKGHAKKTSLGWKKVRIIGYEFTLEGSLLGAWILENDDIHPGWLCLNDFEDLCENYEIDKKAK